MSNYETVFILTPVLSESQMKDAVDKFKSVLNDNGAEVVHEENWGLKKLSYPISHKSTGFYQLIEFTGDPKAVAALEVEYRRDERVMRFLTTKFDKWAQEYSVKRRKGEFKKSEEPKTEAAK